jgi:Spx/MgsR family transcriptional regulator
MTTKINITLFGIPNCDTVKKARTWMETKEIPFVFHNFKKDGLDQTTIEDWLTQLDLGALINRKGTTWKALGDEQKLLADHATNAIALMLSQPSLIKRPVLQLFDGQKKLFNVGFSDSMYQTIFQK